MKDNFAVIAISALLLAACGPTPEQAATLTASAWTPTSTHTATPTETATPTATQTQTPTPTPLGGGRLVVGEWEFFGKNTEGYDIINADGSGLIHLNDGIYHPAYPVAGFMWSPNGMLLASYTQRGQYNCDLNVETANGATKTFLKDRVYCSSDPVWSADSAKLAFAADGPGWKIFTIGVDGSNLTQLTDTITDTGPAWSPDGKQIAFLSNRDPDGGFSEIYVMDADGKNQKRLTMTLFQEFGPIVWSPDGRRLFFQAFEQGVQSSPYVMNSEGSGLTRINLDLTQQESVFTPIWSPDGSRIAFTIVNFAANQKRTVAVVDIASGALLRLVDGTYAIRWEP